MLWAVRDFRPSPKGDYGASNPPPLNFQKFLSCVFAKYTAYALFSYSLNHKFSTGKRKKLYTDFTFCFSFVPSPDLLARFQNTGYGDSRVVGPGTAD